VVKNKVIVDIITNSDKSQKNILKYAAGVTAAVAAVAGLVKVGKDLIDAYAVQETAENNLMAAIRATGEESSISMDAMKAYASSLQDVTLYGDETILSGQSLLQSLADLDQDGLQSVTPHVLDFATAMGIDLKSAMSLVGKTLGSSTNALGRYGIEIDMSGSKSEKLAQLTQALNDKFGGMAEAAGETTTGALKQMRNAVGDLKEELGKSIADGLEPFARATTNLVSKLTSWISTNRKLKEFFDDTKEGGDQASYSLEELHAMLAELERKQMSMADLDLGYDKQIKAIQNLIDAYGMEDQFLIKAREKKLALARLDKENADAEAGRKAEAMADMDALKNAYASTKQGQIDALKTQIAYFEEFKKGPMAVAVLEDLYSQLEALQGKQEELTETTQVFLGDALVPLSDAEAEMWQNYGEGIADSISKTKELTEETFNLGEALNTVGTIQNGLEQFTNQMYDNEIEKLTQTEDAKIQAIEDSYDKRLALMDEDSQAYKDLEKDKIEALKDAEDAKHEVVKAAKEKQWKADKAFAVTKSIIDTISAVTEALPNVPLSVVIGALGAANTAAIAAQPMPAFATGGSFTTTGPTPILVGDNTSGQERITVEPVGGNNGGNQTMILNIDGQQFMGWMQNQLDNGRLRVPRRILA